MTDSRLKYRMSRDEAEALAAKLRADGRWFNVKVLDRCNGGCVVAASKVSSGIYGGCAHRLIWAPEEV